MKKLKLDTNKLTLKKETIASLSASEMKKYIGGDTGPCTTYPCNTGGVTNLCLSYGCVVATGPIACAPPPSSPPQCTGGSTCLTSGCPTIGC